MFGHVIPRSSLWLVSLWTVLIIGIIGCGGGEDDNEWAGTWAMETVDGQSLEQGWEQEFGEGTDVSIVTNNWRFNSDGTMEGVLALKFEAKQQGLEISGKGSIKDTGTYSLSDSNYTITARREATGVFEILDGGMVEDTGTWSRNRDTLTLHSDEDDDEVFVYKKK